MKGNDVKTKGTPVEEKANTIRCNQCGSTAKGNAPYKRANGGKWICWPCRQFERIGEILDRGKVEK